MQTIFSECWENGRLFVFEIEYNFSNELATVRCLNTDKWVKVKFSNARLFPAKLEISSNDWNYLIKKKDE